MIFFDDSFIIYIIFPFSQTIRSLIYSNHWKMARKFLKYIISYNIIYVHLRFIIYPQTRWRFYVYISYCTLYLSTKTKHNSLFFLTKTNPHPLLPIIIQNPIYGKYKRTTKESIIIPHIYLLRPPRPSIWHNNTYLPQNPIKRQIQAYKTIQIFFHHRIIT